MTTQPQSSTGSNGRVVGLCCVCHEPVYRDQNPLVGGEGCALRHRTCADPNPPKRRVGERP